MYCVYFAVDIVQYVRMLVCMYCCNGDEVDPALLCKQVLVLRQILGLHQ